MLRDIYLLVENDNNERNKIGSFYDYVMMSLIFLSLVPLCFKYQTGTMIWIDRITVTVFILDYFIRWVSAGYKYKTRISYFYYPFTPFAVIDLLSILPSLIVLNSGFKLFRLFRLVRILKVCKAFKVFRYSKSVGIIVRVIKNEKSELLAVGTLAIGYIVISALIIFNAEPDTFPSFFDAIYWATMSLTTVGYGDLYPISSIGRWITMISSFFGIAVVALPAGIITAGYMNEIRK